MSLGERFPTVLGAAQSGAVTALEAIYCDLAPSVRGYLRGHGAVAPDDLTSEVFIAVVKGIRGFQGDERSFRSWVFTIAQRRLADERRHRHRHPEDPSGLAQDHDGTDPAARSAEADALDALGQEHALALLATLTDDQRAVVLLRLIGDLPVADVARILGKAEGAVKTLQRRALARLQRELSHKAVSR